MRAPAVLILLAFVSPVLESPAAAQPMRFGEVHRMLPGDSNLTQALALGDVDGDGDLDVLTGNFGPAGHPNRLYLNDGSGFFTDATSNLPGILLNTHAVALADLDGDGDLDAFIGGGPNRLYLNNGAGVFTDATSQLPAGSAASVALGDVDGDGDLDAWIGNFGQDRLFLNDGSGVFSDATSQLPAISDTTHAVALGDVDGDGDLDALAGNFPQNRLYVNNGAGVFSDATSQLPAILDETHAVALGDVDEDGDLDALLGNFAQDRLFLNDGSGVFTDATAQLPSIIHLTRAFALGDVDGDGDLDALLGNYAGVSAAQNHLYLNDGSGFFTDAPSQLPAILDLTQAVALGDVDGDGDLDALIGNTASPLSPLALGQERLYLNDGSGLFAEATSRLATTGDDTRAVVFGDVNGDGALDALVGDGGQSRLYLNDGTGLLTNATSNLPAIYDNTFAVALGDVDGDGDRDALLGNGGQSRLYRNDGSGVFTDATAQLPAILDPTQAVALGDVDGDGDFDALMGNSGLFSPAQSRLYLNDGSGLFTDATAQLPAILDLTRALALGDVDGDGDLDALIGNSGFLPSLAQDRLYLNDGSGHFTDAPSQLPAILDLTEAVALGDVDGDGDLDALMGNVGQDRLYLNDGSGLFADATAQLPAILDDTLSVALGDVDGDGDLDALIGNYNGQQNRLYLNDGSGVFTDATSELPAILDFTTAVAVGDVDGDGDLEAWIGNFSEDFLLTNLTRHLAWRGIPRVGKPLTMDVYGPPSGAWFLAVSLGTANIPLPPIGTLRLDPASLYLVFAGLLDPNGRASWTAPVPANASLIGNSLYWQAIVAGPGRFTNLEATTFTNL